MMENRADIKAEYDAEFDPDDGALAKVDPNEVMELLGPSQLDKNKKVILAFRRRIRDAENEVEEMQQREVYMQTVNRDAAAHNTRLAEERDMWRDLKDPQQLVRSLSERLARAETRLAGYEKAEEEVRVAMQTRRMTWWERLLAWWHS